MSQQVETRELAFRDIEAIVKILSDKESIARAQRLRQRAGLDRLEELESGWMAIAASKAEGGFEAFKKWVEHAGQSIVFTAHPTFSLSGKVYECLGQIATKGVDKADEDIEHLKTLPYRQENPPTLQSEHALTQEALARIQTGLNKMNKGILTFAKSKFPNDWKKLTPCLFKIYSWVGYDIDGRTDIGWADAIRLRISEKLSQIELYLYDARTFLDKEFSGKGNAALESLISRLEDAQGSTKDDLSLFLKDMTDTNNLIEAANHLTRESTRRLRSSRDLFPLIDTLIETADSDDTRMELLLLRSNIRCYGLGTARIHFRMNARHVLAGIRALIGDGENADSHTLIKRAAKMTKSVKSRPVNFASLALEQNTAHRQMILTAQIHKYIDGETPIRLLIAETEDSLIPLGALYLAKLYGLEDHLDISPLLETANGINNGGRIIGKMLETDVYREYIKKRGIMAIQTGFSDAGRFMGQLPATMAIERLQSHFARELARHDELSDVTAIIFNTHGESIGRGGHFGTLFDRLDYAMSPWARHQFSSRGVSFCHENSFQGGDGFFWYQTEELAYAAIISQISSRHTPTDDVVNDPFYTETDFSWDIFRTLSSEQDQLYLNPNYVSLIGPFGQNLLIKTGSRAAKRKSASTETFNPRQIRAIPHNAILQQFGVQANLMYGLGPAASIDPERFKSLLERSDRAQRVFKLAFKAVENAHIEGLTAYAGLFDPGSWLARAGAQMDNPSAAKSSRLIADTLLHHPSRAKLVDLAHILKMNLLTVEEVLDRKPVENKTTTMLQAFRLAVLMKMQILATDLPWKGRPGASAGDVLRLLQEHQIKDVLLQLREEYPRIGEDRRWTEKLIEKTDDGIAPSYPHIVETVITPLARAEQLCQQITIALTHKYDAFG